MVSGDTQGELVQLLKETFRERRENDSAFSLRKFSKQLDVTPSELSLLFRGKRRVTRKTASKLLTRFNTDPQTADRILSRIPLALERKRRKKEQRFTGYVELPADQFSLISDWYYLAILSLAETTHFKSDVLWIARRLGIRPGQAKNAIHGLLRLGLLEEVLVRGATVFRPTGKKLTTSNGVPSSSIRKNHAQALELARRALVEVPLELREFGGAIIAADLSLLPAAKERLRELRYELTDLLESGKSKKQVYRLSFQLFPLSYDLGDRS